MTDKQFTIGGSEVATILGLNPYQGQMDIYLRKLELTEPPTENEAMRWGTAAEHVVVRRYAKENPEAIISPSIDVGFDRMEPFTHPDYPWWTGTPDRLVEPDGILEIKVVGERMAHQWTEDEVPDAYLVQCHWYLGLTGRQWCDLCVQIGNRDYQVHRINRDEEMLETLRVAAEDFLNNHLIPGIPPPIDSSEASSRYLSATYPKDQGEVIKATSDAEWWAEQLALANKQIKHWEEVKALNENLLKNLIGNNRGVESGRWKAIWTKNKDSQKVDWEKAFNMLAELTKAGKNDIFVSKTQNSHIKLGARVFRPYLKELMEED